MPKKQIANIHIATDAKIESPHQTPWFGTLDAQQEEGQLLLDVYQDEKNIYIASTIAGANPEDLEINLNNDMLTIRGTRQAGVDIASTDYFYQECYWGSFSRSIILPMEIKHEKIKADLKNGVLTITLPKAKKRNTIAIDIQN